MSNSFVIMAPTLVLSASFVKTSDAYWSISHSNAFDAVAEDVSDEAPVVTVSTRRDARTVVVVIEVADSGPGIPAELRQQIFEPFFTTKPTGKDMGLGLSLSYDIVTNGHGGSLELVPSERGAHFAIHLPVSAS